MLYWDLSWDVNMDRNKNNRVNTQNAMNVVLGNDSALLGYTGHWKTWAYEMNFVMHHAHGAGSIRYTNKHIFPLHLLIL